MNTGEIKRKWVALAIVIIIVLSAQRAFARTAPGSLPLIHPLFSDNMVLQRDVQFPVWGWTNPGESVTVNFRGRRASAKADAQGRWLVRLGPFEAGGPYELKISGPRSVTFANVLVGDVWLASGQSNMEMGIRQVRDAEKEIAEADNPMIRLFAVPKEIDARPRELVDAHWLVNSPENISSGGWGGFSAVAYFFGRKLQKELGVPIGLIHSSWGGTVAEGWVSKGSLSELPEFREQIANLENSIADLDKGPVNIDKEMLEWWAENDKATAASPTWRDAAFDDTDWEKMRLPRYWENAGLKNFDGIVRFRYKFDLPEDWSGHDLELSLGPIDDCDTTYVNGAPVGATNRWDAPRNYTVTAKMLKPGVNTIAIRVLDTGQGGGVYGEPDQMYIRPVDGSGIPLPLTGEWKYRAVATLSDLKSPPSQSGGTYSLVNARYNAMIAPLFPYGIKGAIWYQGESNVGRAGQYEKVMRLLIRDWKAGFGSGDFPFLIVQLANFMDRRDEPVDSAWARLREAQFKISRGHPKSGLAVTIDIGEADDIHPKNKQDVGLRLALVAMARTYGMEVAFSGPVYRSMKIEGDRIRLEFEPQVSLAQKGRDLKGFEIAGDDRTFVWADAVIEGNRVIVSSPRVEHPVAVRYAWADNPEAGLYSIEGLPAVPFRTDNW